MRISKYIFVYLRGGLGNQLFTFSSAYCYSQKKNKRIIILRSWYHGKQRGKSFDSFKREFLLNRLLLKNSFIILPHYLDKIIVLVFKILSKIYLFDTIIYNEKSQLYDNKLNDGNYLYINGYLQSDKYLCENIRSLYSNITNIRRQIHLNFQDKRIVAIHVRREDTLVKGNEWTGLLSVEYYKKAVNLFSQSNYKFVIFSDSIEWCKSQKFFNDIDAFFIDEPDPVKTLSLMQSCDDFIIAGSTLSWWGAWLSNSIDKRVVIPWPFFEKIDHHKQVDLIPKGWIKLGAIFLKIEN